MAAIWMPVPGFEGFYEVSNAGQVKSLDRYVEGKNGSKRKLKEKTLKSGISTTGYHQVILQKYGLKYTFRVHRLVAAAFINNPEEKPCVNHIDGDKLNANVENLEWVTYSENNVHAFATGLQVTSNPNKNGNFQGSKCGISKLNEKDVLYIRKNSIRNNGSLNDSELARFFCVSRQAIRAILIGRSWSHI